MKKVFMFLLGIGVLFLLTACYSEYRETHADVSNGSVTLSLKENTLSATGASFVLKNYSKDTIIYGVSYSLEKEVDGEWMQLREKEDLVFTMQGLILEAGMTQDIDVDWSYHYGVLGSGQYR